VRRIVGLACADHTATWSEGMFEVYGLAPGSPQSLQTALAHIHPDDRTIVERPVRRILRSSTADNVEPYLADHRIVHPHEGLRWLHSAGRVIFGDDGRPARIRGLTRDVTDTPIRHIMG
jgi:hypothetical protein